MKMQMCLLWSGIIGSVRCNNVIITKLSVCINKYVGRIDKRDEMMLMSLRNFDVYSSYRAHDKFILNLSGRRVDESYYAFSQASKSIIARSHESNINFCYLPTGLGGFFNFTKVPGADFPQFTSNAGSFKKSRWYLSAVFCQHSSSLERKIILGSIDVDWR